MYPELLPRLFTFFTGVIITSSYFMFMPTDEAYEIQATSYKYQAVETEKVSSQQANNAYHSVIKQDKKQEVSQLTALKTKIVALQLQLKKQDKTINALLAQRQNVQTQYTDTQSQLETRFAQEPRDEAWAYSVETALSDFLITTDLSINPVLKHSECKTTVCQFTFIAPKDTPAFDSRIWRELNQQLIKQPWFQQFKMTRAQSNDSQYRFSVSTAL